MSKKHIFLSIFSKIAIFACVFCTFFASPVFAALPAGYQALESLQSTQQQYINITDVTLTDQSKIICKFAANSFENTNLFGGRGSTTSKPFTFGIYQNKWRIGWNNATNTYGTADNNTHTVVFDGKNREIYLDDVLLTELSDNTFTTPINMALFAVKASNQMYYGDFIVYSCEIYADGTTLSHNFIPAKRNGDGEIGMYDMVTNTFFTNQGTGSFIAGPVAEIKIATTKMVDEEFAAAEAKLATTVQTIESVVSRTISQTEQIQILQDTKQTRPNETCPANMKCLLVQDEDGTPHWYPIIEP